MPVHCIHSPKQRADPAIRVNSPVETRTKAPWETGDPLSTSKPLFKFMPEGGKEGREGGKRKMEWGEGVKGGKEEGREGGREGGREERTEHARHKGPESKEHINHGEDSAVGEQTVSRQIQLHQHVLLGVLDVLKKVRR